MTDSTKPVRGYCPACGRPGLKLILAFDQIRCTLDDCPDLLAASKLLEDSQEIHHILRLRRVGTKFTPVFNILHPIRERVEYNLLDCDIHNQIQDHCKSFGWPDEGTYRLRPSSEHNLDVNLIWERLP